MAFKFTKGYTPWNKGLRVSGMSGKRQSEHQKQVIRERNLRNNPSKSKEVREKMRLAKLGKVGPTKGKSWKVKDTSKMGLKGELHWNWKDGKTPELRLLKNSTSWKKWREKVFERDNYTCQDCGKRGEIIHPHHLKSFVKFEELRFEITNGITLCEECHYRRHSKNVQI